MTSFFLQDVLRDLLFQGDVFRLLDVRAFADVETGL
jgi:hypothetical protein